MGKNKKTKNAISSLSFMDRYLMDLKTKSETIYEGKKNETEFPDFVSVCKLSKNGLKEHLNMVLEDYYPREKIISGDGYLFVTGEIPFAVTAHMDTVHRELIKDFYEKIDKNGHHIISSPQGIGGDDRCGIYMILKLLEAGYRPYIIFCEDEEIGCVGSTKFIKHKDLVDELKNCNYIIELDRKGSDDAVFYSCHNPEFTSYIIDKTKYVERYGSCSDISIIAPIAEIAAVNLSCGYYNPHQMIEYVDYEEMMNTVGVVKDLLDDKDCQQYKYMRKTYTPAYSYSSYGFNWRDYYPEEENDDYPEDDYGYCEPTRDGGPIFETDTATEKYEIEVEFLDNYYGETNYASAKGTGIMGAIANFLIQYSEVSFSQISYIKVMDEKGDTLPMSRIPKDVGDMIKEYLIDFENDYEPKRGAVK